MPTNACQFFYDCKGCGERLKPKLGIVVCFALTALLHVHRCKLVNAASKVIEWRSRCGFIFLFDVEFEPVARDTLAETKWKAKILKPERREDRATIDSQRKSTGSGEGDIRTCKT